MYRQSMWRRFRRDHRCSFCGQRKRNAELVRGRERRANICASCVSLAADVLAEDRSVVAAAGSPKLGV